MYQLKEYDSIIVDLNSWTPRMWVALKSAVSNRPAISHINIYNYLRLQSKEINEKYIRINDICKLQEHQINWQGLFRMPEFQGKKYTDNQLTKLAKMYNSQDISAARLGVELLYNDGIDVWHSIKFLTKYNPCEII